MRTIHKYKLGPLTGLPIPRTATVLCVQMQRDDLCMWVELDNSHAIERERVFHVFGTGHQIPDSFSGKYIGTVQTQGLVLHVYEQNLFPVSPTGDRT
jgi:hypothetical protein